MSPEWTKAVVLVSLFVLTMIFSFLPIKVVKIIRNRENRDGRRIYKSIISLLNCFAAGVFLATCLLDLFPEVKDQISNVLQEADISSSFPIAEFLLTCGLFMILILEQIVLTVKQNSGPPSPKYLRSSSRTSRDFYSYSDEQSGLLASESDYESIASEDHMEETQAPGEDPLEHSKIRSLLLLAALSLHSVFEGLAVGLQPDSSKVLQIFAALTLHKSILAFSLGLKLVQSGLSMRHIAESNILFCVMSPLGIGIGIALTDFTSNLVSFAINGTLQGLACGTFLYIVFFEILPHEFKERKRNPPRLLKILLLLIGYSIVTLLQFLDPDINKSNSQSCNNET